MTSYPTPHVAFWDSAKYVNDSTDDDIQQTDVSLILGHSNKKTTAGQCRLYREFSIAKFRFGPVHKWISILFFPIDITGEKDIGDTGGEASSDFHRTDPSGVCSSVRV